MFWRRKVRTRREKLVDRACLLATLAGGGLFVGMLTGRIAIEFPTLWVANALLVVSAVLAGISGTYSARRRARQVEAGEAFGWLGPAKGLVGPATGIAAWLGAALMALSLAPLDDLAWRLAADDGPPMRIDVAPGGREAFVSGVIREGFAGRLRDVLDAHPGIETIQLKGPGGLAREATQAVAIIRDRGLSTFARGDCASSCAEIFLAGRRRTVPEYAAGSGILQFHRAGFRVGDLAVTLPGDEGLRAYAGSQRLRDRIREVAFSDIWAPSRDELVGYGIVTGFESSDDHPFQVVGVPSLYSPQAMERAFLGEGGVPSWKAVQGMDPRAVQEAILGTWADLAKGKPYDRSFAANRYLLNRVALLRLSSADDGMVREAATYLADAMDGGRAGPPGAADRGCLRIGRNLDLLIASGRQGFEVAGRTLFERIARLPPDPSLGPVVPDRARLPALAYEDLPGGDCRTLIRDIRAEAAAGPEGALALRRRIADVAWIGGETAAAVTGP